MSGFTSPIFAIQKFVTFDAIQAKEKSYHDQHPNDQFFLLAIKVFECLHKQAYVFLHDRANAIWSFKDQKAFLFLSLLLFFVKIFWSHY